MRTSSPLVRFIVWLLVVSMILAVVATLASLVS